MKLLSSEENSYRTVEMVNTEKGKQSSLPHGNSIDADWTVKTKDHFISRNKYHCLNEGGFYDGWIDFSLKISKNTPLEFQLQFHTGNAGWYRIGKYMLREYLEDLFAMTFSELN